jgi:hypothetical protein
MVHRPQCGGEKKRQYRRDSPQAAECEACRNASSVEAAALMEQGGGGLGQLTCALYNHRIVIDG